MTAIPNTRYRLYCDTEQSFVYEWAQAPPTVCPNDPAHIINLDSVKPVDLGILYTYSIEKEILDITPARFLLIPYVGSSGITSQVNIVCNKTGVSDGQIIVQNETTVQPLLITPITNETEEYVSIGELDPPPTKGDLIGVYATESHVYTMIFLEAEE